MSNNLYCRVAKFDRYFKKEEWDRIKATEGRPTDIGNRLTYLALGFHRTFFANFFSVLVLALTLVSEWDPSGLGVNGSSQ